MSTARSGVATKADLRALESKLARVEDRLEAKITGVEDRLEQVSEAQHRTGVLLERIDANVQIIVEGQTTMRDQLVARIDSLENGHSERLDDVEDVVREHSRDISAVKRRLRMSK